MGKFNLTERVNNDIVISLEEMRIKQLKQNLFDSAYMINAVEGIADLIIKGDKK